MRLWYPNDPHRGRGGLGAGGNPRPLQKTLQEKPESWDPGFRSLWGFFLSPTERAASLVARIQDMGERRLADMDATGIARQLVSLSSPGVQVFDASTAVSLSWEYNDQLIEKVNANPDRFSGLAAIAPQSPGAAAKELQRAVKLGLKGAVVNPQRIGNSFASVPRNARGCGVFPVGQAVLWQIICVAG